MGKLDKLSVFISLVLRHNPDAAHITLDEHGWADVEELLAGINDTGRQIDRNILEEIVATDNKKRYSFNQDKTLIRANQGHSIPVDVELKEQQPPEVLYHGTATRFLDSIMKEGLKPMSRLYVHLSKDTDTAWKVGKRHGSPVILEIHSGDMYRDGCKFYLSENGVWLTKEIGTRYFKKMSSKGNHDFLEFILKRFKIEREKFDRSGVYAYTQRLLAYNSNKIEGSTLTEEQTASLFDNGTLPKSDDYYRAKDVEEMNGHFLMFNRMLDTLDLPLSQELIKQFHYELKSGVFEDRANGYAIGDYKKRPNMIGMYQTVRPEHIADEMGRLLEWYDGQKTDIAVLAEFHARYESIHPFQDGNGRTGRLILFRECLRNGIVPVVIEDANRSEYLDALKEYREEKKPDKLTRLFEKEQKFYLDKCQYFL